MENVKKLGIVTSGGDCSGLNAVIESVVRTATQKGFIVYGFNMGYDGLLANDYVELTDKDVKGMARQGGSMIGNSNKTNLFSYRSLDNGTVSYKDVSDQAVENLKKDGI